MKLSEDTVKNITLAITTLAVATYNIEYSFTASPPSTLWAYLQQLLYMGVVSYLGIFILVILPTGLLVSKLEGMIDTSYLPITHRYTTLSDAVVIVSCVTITVITLLMWLSHHGFHLN